MSFVDIKGLKVTLGDFTLKDICISLDKGDYLSVIGPTGSGKTIFLESIVGVFKHCRGRICIKERDITRARPETRGVGIVYQDYVLMPHMTVFQNMAYGLKKDKDDTPDRAIEKMADSLHIGHLLHRKPGTLSGGEQQRVALGRALIAKPALLLLDEPFSALDRQTRAKARILLKEAVNKSGTTVIHITHDLDDAWSLADKLAVFKDGQMLCFGPLNQVVSRPGSKFAAEFMGTGVYPGIVVPSNKRTTLIDTNWGRLSSNDHATPGEQVDLFIRNENIHITRNLNGNTRDTNVIQGVISAMIPQGPLVHIDLSMGPHTMNALVPASQVDRHALDRGDRVYAIIKNKHICIGGQEPTAPELKRKSQHE